VGPSPALNHEIRAAAGRSKFSVVITQLKGYLREHGLTGDSPVTCFVSYAWGDREQENWVRRRLSPDLEQAGIRVLLDVRENRLGDNIGRYVERLDTADYVVVVGTPDYRRKYDNRSEHGFVVAAEGDMINGRLTGSEDRKRSVIPLLHSGDFAASLPPLMQTRIAGDLRREEDYFARVFDLICAIYQADLRDTVLQELRDALGAA